MLTTCPSALAFQQATRRVARTQTELLGQMLWQNRGTQFGRQHAFARNHTPRDYQDQVPLATYEQFAVAVQAIAAGQTNVLNSLNPSS